MLLQRTFFLLKCSCFICWLTRIPGDMAANNGTASVEGCCSLPCSMKVSKTQLGLSVELRLTQEKIVLARSTQQLGLLTGVLQFTKAPIKGLNNSYHCLLSTKSQIMKLKGSWKSGLFHLKEAQFAYQMKWLAFYSN